MQERRCKYCNDNFDPTVEIQVFCKDSCREKYGIRKNRNKYPYKPPKKNFPEWTCENGHKVKLDFYPLKDIKRFDELKCTKCNE